jgi:capsular exopolysaccharide synthesis family protein
MPQYELNLRDYWRIIRRRKEIVILCFVVVLSASVIFSLRQKTVYKASTRVKVEQRRTMAGLLMEELIYWGRGDPLITQAEVITSRRIAEETAKEMGLVNENSPQFDAVVTGLKNSISTEGILNASIIKITAVAEKPEEAIKIVNTVTQVYRRVSREDKIKQSGIVRDFIKEQLGVVEEDLIRSEEAFKKFKEERAISALGTKKDLTLKNLDRVQADLIKVKIEREEAGQLINQLKEEGRIGRVLQASPLLDNDSFSSSLKKELVDLESEFSALGEYYTGKHPKILKVGERINLLSRQLQERLESRIGILQREENSLRERKSQLGNELKLLPAKELKFERLARELRANEERYKNLKEKFDSASIAEAEKTSDITWIDRAVSAIPITTGRKTVALAGGIIGLILGLVFAFVRESLDTSIGTIEDVESFLKIPVLGVIPHIETKEEEKRFFWQKKPAVDELTRMRTSLVTKFDPKSPVSEAYRILRTNVEFLGPKEKAKVLLLTSTGPREGKTTVAANLAVSIAQVGKKTLLIESDLRKPFVSKLFGIKREPGLTDILIGSVEWKKALRTLTDILMGSSGWEEALQVPGLDNLSILTAGYLPPNPSEILNSEPMADLLNKMKDEFDVIILDSPPVLPVADAVILSSKVDGIIMVYYVGRVARSALSRAKAQLDVTGANIYGIVLNDIKAAEMSMYPTYYYHYYRYYGEEEEKRKRKKKS